MWHTSFFYYQMQHFFAKKLLVSKIIPIFALSL